MNHNFYRFYCNATRDVPSWSHYYTACQDRYKKYLAGDTIVTDGCPDAMRKGTCCVPRMMAEEMSGKAVYYVDRDDVGLGVMSRAELGLPPRTADEVARHHAYASKLKVSIKIRTPQQEAAFVAAAKRAREEAERARLHRESSMQQALTSRRRTQLHLDEQRGKHVEPIGLGPAQATNVAAPDVAQLINAAVAAAGDKV